MSVLVAPPRSAAGRPAMVGVVIIAGSSFTRSALGMAFAAFGREVPVLYSGPSARAAIAGVGVRGSVSAIVAVDALGSEVESTILELVEAGMSVTVLAGLGVPADGFDDLPVARVVTEERANVQDVIGEVLGTGASSVGAPVVRPLPLSDMQRRVLAMFATGSSLTDIAKDLGVRPETVRTHLKRVRARYREVGVHLPSRRDLYHVARMSGLVA